MMIIEICCKYTQYFWCYKTNNKEKATNTEKIHIGSQQLKPNLQLRIVMRYKDTKYFLLCKGNFLKNYIFLVKSK
jgi:hypothetical protein